MHVTTLYMHKPHTGRSSNGFKKRGVDVKTDGNDVTMLLLGFTNKDETDHAFCE